MWVFFPLSRNILFFKKQNKKQKTTTNRQTDKQTNKQTKTKQNKTNVSKFFTISIKHLYNIQTYKWFFQTTIMVLLRRNLKCPLPCAVLGVNLVGNAFDGSKGASAAFKKKRGYGTLRSKFLKRQD